MSIDRDQGYTRIFTQIDAGQSPISHEAGIKARDVSKMGHLQALYAKLFGHFVEWKGTTYLVGEKSLAAFIGRNREYFGKKPGEKGFDIDSALSELRAAAKNAREKDIQSRQAELKTQKATRRAVLVTDSELKEVAEHLGITGEPLTTTGIRGSVEITKETLRDALPQHGKGVHVRNDLPPDLQALNNAAVAYLKTNDESAMSQVVEELVTPPSPEQPAVKERKKRAEKKAEVDGMTQQLQRAEATHRFKETVKAIKAHELFTGTYEFPLGELDEVFESRAAQADSKYLRRTQQLGRSEATHCYKAIVKIIKDNENFRESLGQWTGILGKWARSKSPDNKQLDKLLQTDVKKLSPKEFKQHIKNFVYLVTKGYDQLATRKDNPIPFPEHVRDLLQRMWLGAAKS